MLFTQAARDLYQRTHDGWARLEAWLDAPANAGAVASILAPISGLRSHWHDVDDGVLSDPDDIAGSFKDLQTAVNYAKPQGYQPDANTEAPGPSEDQLHPFMESAQAVEDWAQKHPVVDWATDPGNKSAETDAAKCKKAGFICTGAVTDLPWWVWGIGIGGAAILVGATYTVYTKADTLIPVALALGAPEALPEYRRLREGAYRAPAHVTRAVEEELR